MVQTSVNTTAAAGDDDASHCDVIDTHPEHLLLNIMGSAIKFVFYHYYFWAIVRKRFALLYRIVVCLYVLSACDVGVLWPNGWMDHCMPLGAEVGLGPGNIVSDVDPDPSMERGTARLCGFRHISTSGFAYALVGLLLSPFAISCAVAPDIASLNRYGRV